MTCKDADTVRQGHNGRLLIMISKLHCTACRVAEIITDTAEIDEISQPEVTCPTTCSLPTSLSVGGGDSFSGGCGLHSLQWLMVVLHQGSSWQGRRAVDNIPGIRARQNLTAQLILSAQCVISFDSIYSLAYDSNGFREVCLHKHCTVTVTLVT